MNPKNIRGNSSTHSGTPNRHAEESENEEMDESGLSDGVGGDSDERGDTTDEDEDATDDSSDMDASECEKKRFEYIDDLTDLEKQFAILREQLYRERMTQIEAKLEEVKTGKAAEYLQPLEELQVNMKNRMEVGVILRDLRMQNLQCKFDAEELAAQQNFENEKHLLWDAIKTDLEEKIHMLEEDKNNIDLTSNLWEQSSRIGRRKKADPNDPDRRKKPVTVTGPYIVYMLRDADILEDWTQIRKSLTSRKKTDYLF